MGPESYKKCNATQVDIIQNFRNKFIAAAAPAIDPSSKHGAFVDSCPNQHCQTSTGWNTVHVQGVEMGAAAARWYFNNTSTKIVDAPFPGNPTCGYREGVESMCNNCANKGLGSNCIWDEKKKQFHGLEV